MMRRRLTPGNRLRAATWYRLSVYDGTGPLVNKWVSAVDAACSGGGHCLITPETPLPKGDKTWWVQPWKEDKIYGPWSDGMAFSVGPEPGKAVLVSPSGAAGLKPTYTWNAVLNSTWYYLYVNDSTGKRVDKWYTAAEAKCSIGTGTCSVKPDIALALGAGKWWIQTWNEVGYGPWSAAEDYGRRRGLATLSLPSGLITDPMPTYTWRKAQRFNLVSAVGEWTIRQSVLDQWYEDTADNATCSGTTCSVTPSTSLASRQL